MTNNRSTHPKFLSSLFGNLGGKRIRRQQQQYKGSEGMSSGQSSGESLPLGAAEVMRRKMLGLAALDGKARDRS